MSQTKIRIGQQLQQSTTPGSIVTSDALNAAQWFQPPVGNKVLWWDNSNSQLAWLAIGTNLSISSGTLNASAGAGGYSTIQSAGISQVVRSVLNFTAGGITAADDSGNNRTNVTLHPLLSSFAGLTLTLGDIFYATSSSAITNLAAVASGSALISTGVASAPA